MSFQPRIPTTFESIDGTTVLTFGVAEYEWDSSQPLYVPSVPLVGANYAYDQLGSAPPVKQNARETLRFVVYEDTPAEVDTAIDALKARCVSIGLGKLWLTASDGSRRWAYARVAAMPALHWAAGDILRKAVSIDFDRQSDWYASSQSSSSNVLASDPDTFTIANPSANKLFNSVIRIANTWTSPVTIENTTNGYGIVYSGDDGVSPNDVVRFDAGTGRVDRSADGGSTWTQDYADYAPLAAGQVQIMVLEPGDNDFSVASANGATVTVLFYPAF
jgi:hypothetical protein